VNNLGNPKMAVFFASVLPEFTESGQWMVYATVIPTAGRLLRVSRAQRAIEAVSGTVMIGLGVRVAADAR
jgi:threonine/homoserine/homoserine lactone efflux protein